MERTSRPKGFDFPNSNQTFLMVHDGCFHTLGEFIIGLALEGSAGFTFSDTTPLLKEERHLGFSALVPD
jgi:hypothetical protein